ncbi:flagellin [Marinovum sp.]|uniref:flagellin n=1 Tax=Marinovum sp. TaxID=2024839 RepID=UPI002B27100B|nr:flagellin [Marinovum sp.]
MNLTTIGDLSQSYMLRQRQTHLTSETARLQTELTTGRVADTRSHLRGDYAHLGDIERSLSMQQGYGFAIAESETLTTAMQTALGAVQAVTSDLSTGLVLAGQGGSTIAVTTASFDAEQAFTALVSHLNTRAAGRSLFAGAAYGSAALAPPEDMLTALRGVLSGEVTLTGVQAALDTWFDSGGGFEADGYEGDTEDGTPLQLSEDLRLGLSLRADDQVFRDALKATAKAALAADVSLGFADDLRESMVISAGTELIALQPDLTGVIAGLGIVQSRIEDSKVRNEAAGLALEMSRNTLLSADQYEAATRFELVQTQIETLYAVTVRASRMSLLDYMR